MFFHSACIEVITLLYNIISKLHCPSGEFFYAFFTRQVRSWGQYGWAMTFSALYNKWEIWIIDVSYYIPVNNSRPVLPAPGANFVLWATIKTHKCHNCSSEGGQQHTFRADTAPVPSSQESPIHMIQSLQLAITHCQNASWGYPSGEQNHCNHLTTLKLYSQTQVLSSCKWFRMRQFFHCTQLAQNV